MTTPRLPCARSHETEAHPTTKRQTGQLELGADAVGVIQSSSASPGERNRPCRAFPFPGGSFHSRASERAMAEPIVSGATAVPPPPPGAPSFSYLAVFYNCPLVAAVLAFAIAQSIKVLTTWYALLSPSFPRGLGRRRPGSELSLSLTGSASAARVPCRYKENRWDAKQLVGSGGMPSSHSATVTALAVAVGLQEGFASSLFATAAVFASVVGSLSLSLSFDTQTR